MSFINQYFPAIAWFIAIGFFLLFNYCASVVSNRRDRRFYKQDRRPDRRFHMHDYKKDPH